MITVLVVKGTVSICALANYPDCVDEQVQSAMTWWLGGREHSSPDAFNFVGVVALALLAIGRYILLSRVLANCTHS